MEQQEDYSELIEWLKEKGHSNDEIKKILAAVRQYEIKTQHDSVMDSIGSGSLDLDSLILEALGD